MKVRLNFSVSENALPAIIVVRSMCGGLVLYKKVYCKQNYLCFCTKSRNLIITVRPFNADFYEQSYFIKFGRCPVYDIRLNFNFTAQSAAALQTFYLYDKNYLFPVKSAELYFSGWSIKGVLP